jgi:hypothetical protein
LWEESRYGLLGSGQPLEKAIDLAEEGFLLAPCVDRKAGPVCPQTNVGEEAFTVLRSGGWPSHLILLGGVRP